MRALLSFDERRASARVDCPSAVQVLRELTQDALEKSGPAPKSKAKTAKPNEPIHVHLSSRVLGGARTQLQQDTVGCNNRQPHDHQLTTMGLERNRNIVNRSLDGDGLDGSTDRRLGQREQHVEDRIN